MLEYKNYLGIVDFDSDAQIFPGEVVNIRHVITFQDDSVKGLKKAFIDSIEVYLAFCAERGEDPDRPFSSNLHIRFDSETHRAAYLAAKSSGISLNHWIRNVIARNATD
ncbi:MAG: protein encoded in hypervariable junction of pilus cluster [Gammaproteobacteria bacterium]|jgi:predicted HicB family RNase H-like nuclease|nr:protein encoded in hypervariable junction of pilus cluster [Gammaproteobacteria bacterium]